MMMTTAPGEASTSRATAKSTGASYDLASDVMNGSGETASLDPVGVGLAAAGLSTGRGPRAANGANGATSSVRHVAPPPAPPPHLANPAVPPTDLLQPATGIGADEVYGNDEQALNDFVVLHPMLSVEATSQKALQLMSGLFGKSKETATLPATTTLPDLPVIKKSYDDAMLRPPNRQIGERECACGDRCIARFLAQWRHGKDTDLAFTCCEFLLPDEQTVFLEGRGLPPRRKKCLLCTRYLTSFLYYRARLDPNFTLVSKPTNIEPQPFANIAAPSAATGGLPDVQHLNATQAEFPTSVSEVLADDAYRPDAMLFVDEGFHQCRASRQSPTNTFVFRPIVKFCSKHYVFERTPDGPRIFQRGVAAIEVDDSGELFRSASAISVASPGRRPA